jgi:diaminohydroxyphosphoribosylaminopyrimidine deaminase/5-amino-6-(5-phosphoribosylamino)uracil reductase
VTDRDWLAAAIEESRRCPPSATAFSVGAIVVGPDGAELARGYSREGDEKVHAEESALAKLADADPAAAVQLSGGQRVGRVPPGSTVFSSLEPCSQRASRPHTWREPAIFVAGDGARVLADAGVTVLQLPELAAEVADINVHLLAHG